MIPIFNWKNKRILIVEDEEVNLKFLEAVLRKTQAELLWTDNGVDAVEIVEREKNIDLILMDIRLPVMDGCEATKIIKSKNKSMPVIAQTAYALKGDEESIRKSGCDEYLTKPLDFEKLLEIMNKYLAD